MSDTKRAVLFIRARHAGTDEQAATEAQISAQRAAGQEAAQQLNAEIVHEYVEHGGTDRLERRPVVRQMLAELAQTRDIDYVITSGYDRLARRVSDLQDIEAGVEAAGAVLAIPGELRATGYSPIVHKAMAQMHYTMAALVALDRKEARHGTPRHADLAR